MAGRRVPIALLGRDGGTGNWTVTPSPDPNPPEHPMHPAQNGPPYASTMAVVGGVPTLTTDVPVAAVFLGLFVASAAAHMMILQLNRRAGLKFLFSGMLFALCALRSVALSMRIVWAAYPRTVNVALAAGILAQTGSVLVFVVNLLLTQRVVRAYHPAFGWHPATNLAFRFLIACVLACLVMVVVVTAQSFFTLDAGVRHADRIVQLFAGTYMATLAFLPLPVIALAALLPRAQHVERFGGGRWRNKVRLLLATSALATLGAAFRVYTGYAARSAAHPGWWHSRACYYCFNFVIDLLVSALYLFSRFDRRFIVPNGAKGPGDYGKGVRVRPSSAASSNGGEERGNETDPEKLAKLGTNGNEDGGEGVMYDDKANDKGKGKHVDVESDDKEDVDRPVSPRGVDSGTQTYGPGGHWNGVPWPFRTSWGTSRNRGAAGASANQSSEGDSAEAELPADYSAVDGLQVFGGIDDTSSQWGAETSSTYVPEVDPAPWALQHYGPYPVQHRNVPVLGQAFTSNEEIQLDTVGSSENLSIWPFTSETQASGRDPITNGPSRNSSTATTYRPGPQRMPSRGHVSRSHSHRAVELRSIEGGWI
ncbi:hypothetical protein F4802DRAFT_389532 [Xylaria palmicola]|nr:hypothetical protein F4802DRAFT_389532 [Xylaria palmicola]